MNKPFQTELLKLLPRLRGFAFGLCSNQAEADDLVQAGVERALRAQDQWQEGTRMDSWMYRIIQNLWIDQLRSRKGHGDFADPELLESLPAEDWNRDIEARLTLEQVLIVMQTLPAAMREVLTLVTLEGQSYQEAAEVCGVPVGTVMSRLSRARSELMKRLADRPQGVAA